MHALVVEDNESLANFVSDVLSHNGFVVTCASNGRDGAIAVGERFFDLVLTDNQMDRERKFWGKELVKRVKFRHPESTTILMSSEDIKNHEADAFLLKPFNLTQIEDVLIKLFGAEKLHLHKNDS